MPWKVLPKIYSWRSGPCQTHWLAYAVQVDNLLIKNIDHLRRIKRMFQPDEVIALDLSTTTRIVFHPSDFGSPLMKSNDMSVQTWSGIGNGCRRPWGDNAMYFFCWHTVQQATKSLTSFFMPFQYTYYATLLYVLKKPELPPYSSVVKFLTPICPYNKTSLPTTINQTWPPVLFITLQLSPACQRLQPPPALCPLFAAH